MEENTIQIELYRWRKLCVPTNITIFSLQKLTATSNTLSLSLSLSISFSPVLKNKKIVELQRLLDSGAGKCHSRIPRSPPTAESTKRSVKSAAIVSSDHLDCIRLYKAIALLCSSSLCLSAFPSSDFSVMNNRSSYVRIDYYYIFGRRDQLRGQSSI